MAVFQIADANPLRFFRQSAPDLFEAIQDGKCYLQKWEKTDSTKIQILTDYEIESFGIYDAHTNILIATVPVVEIAVNILNPELIDVKCYEVSLAFGALEGQYYAKIIYDTNVEIFSEPFDVQTEQNGTILINYKNSENNFSIIFTTSISFNLRVEGTIQEFTPASEDVIYNDQKFNATMLNSIPFRTYKLYISGSTGLPDWMTDKVNRALSMDQKQIDGNYYEKVEGAKWEVIREVENPFSGMTIEIMPVENVFLQRIKTGDQPPTGYTIVEKVKTYYGNSANIVTDIFAKYSLFKNLSVINYGGALTINVGLTDGGTEIGQFTVPAGSVGGEGWNQIIHWMFTAITPVYITGLTGSNADILINYLQYDATPAQPIPQPPQNLPKNAAIRFYEIAPGDFAAAFDLSTGLGKPAAGWTDWVIIDGRNGTIDEGGRVPVTYKESDPDYGIPGSMGGLKEEVMDILQMPIHDHEIIHGKDKRGTTGTEQIWSNFGTDGINTTEESGGNPSNPGGAPDPISKMQPYITAIWVLKVA